MLVFLVRFYVLNFLAPCCAFFYAQGAVAAVAALAALAVPVAAHAGFFIPKDNWMAMTTVTPDEIDLDLAYGVCRDTSVSVGLTRVRETATDTPSGIVCGRLRGRSELD